MTGRSLYWIHRFHDFMPNLVACMGVYYLKDRFFYRMKDLSVAVFLACMVAEICSSTVELQVKY
jgi:hypothetical protein